MQDRSEIGFIIEEAKGLARLLYEWRISQVKRENNQVANDLARCSKSQEVSWGLAPVCVEEALDVDCTNILPS